MTRPKHFIVRPDPEHPGRLVSETQTRTVPVILRERDQHLLIELDGNGAITGVAETMPPRINLGRLVLANLFEEADLRKAEWAALAEAARQTEDGDPIH